MTKITKPSDDYAANILAKCDSRQHGTTLLGVSLVFNIFWYYHIAYTCISTEKSLIFEKRCRIDLTIGLLQPLSLIS